MTRRIVRIVKGSSRPRGVELAGSTLALLLPALSAAAGTIAPAPGLVCMNSSEAANASLSQTIHPYTTPTFDHDADTGAPARADEILFLSITSDPGATTPERQLVGDVSNTTNYRGEQIDAAVTRFWEDFEDGAVGPEWSVAAPIVEDELETRFSFIPTDAGMTLNLLTKAGEVYEAQIDLLLFPPVAARPDEAPPENDNLLVIKVDGEVVLQFAPEDIAKLRGETAEPGKPVRRKIRVPFTAGFGIAEMRFEASDPKGAGDWSRWAIDNILVDLGLQDPVFGFSGEMSRFDPGILGMTGLSDGLTGELPPGKRFGNNDSDFSGGGGGGGNSPPDRAIPGPGGVVLAAIALAKAISGTRRRRI